MVVQVQDLSYLVQAMGNDPFSQRYRKLSLGLCEVQCNLTNVCIMSICLLAHAVDCCCLLPFFHQCMIPTKQVH